MGAGKNREQQRTDLRREYEESIPKVSEPTHPCVCVCGVCVGGVCNVCVCVYVVAMQVAVILLLWENPP